MKILRERVAVVTGAASGIGFALASAFAREGMKVVLADIEEPRLEPARQTLAAKGAQVLAVRTDVSDQQSVERLRDAAMEAFGAVHVVCNNAGVSLKSRAPIWEASNADWEWMLGVNIWGVIHGVRTFTPVLLEQPEAHVVNTASIAGLIPAVLGIYSVTKHAVVAISESLQLQLATANANVGVSVLCPGWVRTHIGDAERNRPAHLRSAAREPISPDLETARAALLASGTSPEMVAECVLDAIRTDRFYVLPHPEWLTVVRDRTDAIERGAPPPTVDLASTQRAR